MEKSKNERNEGARELCAILAHNVKELRKRKTLSQEKLSEITGLSVNEIGRIERNKTITGLGVLHALAKGLDISPERLLDPDWIRRPFFYPPLRAGSHWRQYSRNCRRRNGRLFCR